MAGIDENAKLVLHMDGTDESTVFTDSSDFSHSDTAIGNAQIDTAQSKFGGASGLFGGAGDRVEYPDSPDWDFGTNDMAIDCWIRFNSFSGNQAIIGRATSGGSYFYWQVQGTIFRFRDFNGVNNIDFTRTVSLSVDTWYHVAVTRSGSDFRMFLDGTQIGATFVNSNAFIERSDPLEIGQNSVIAHDFNGHIDEMRVSNGDSRWTSNFTPPTSAYTSDTETVSDDLEITDSIEITDTTIEEIDDLEITDTIQVIDTTVQETDNLQISDSIFTQDTTVQESDNLEITDSIIITSTNVDAKFISKIISINPLIFVTDTNPIEIIKVDTTDPSNLTWIVQTVPGVSNGKDVAVNTSNNFIYIAGNAGQVVKVEIADLSNQTIIDVGDTDDLLTIETNSNHGITYAGTENEIGELYVIDERNTFSMDSDFQVIAPMQFLIDSDFNTINTFKMDSDFQVLAQQTFSMDSDFKCITKPTVPPPPTVSPLDVLEPIKLTDFQVFIDSVELENTDLILDSISITHSESEQSRALFRLTRKHDQLNTTLKGISSEITNQNAVVIKIQGVVEFDGDISELDCQYADSEFVVVTALSEEKPNQFNNVTLSLPSVDGRLSLYDILIQNPKIFYGSLADQDDDENPKKFKGIRVNLGDQITQNINKITVSDGKGQIASQIQNGTFNPFQNWTYFWGTVGATNFGDVALGDTIAEDFFYVGTSLAPVSEDLWNLTKASHHRQRIYDDDIIKLGDGTVAVSDFDGLVNDPTSVHLQLQQTGFLLGGAGVITKKFKETTDSSELELKGINSNEQTAVYEEIEKQLGFTVGEAPFEDISVRNGVLVTKPKLVDEPDRLSSIKDASFNFTEYAKKVANLEFNKLQNINENTFPETSCTFNLTVDAYLYYDISLLTTINVDNTTTTNIYNNANGFPVSAKSITITSADRRVSIEADNTKSTRELEEIDGDFPSEDDDEYNEKEQRTLIALKTDMRTRNQVE